VHESDLLTGQMHEWARGLGLDPSSEAFDETEAWDAFFDDHPEEFNRDLDSADKPKLFRELAAKLVQADSRVVGSAQQYGLQHDPITGTQVKAGPAIQALPKKERHPATLQAYLESREHQTERFNAPARSSFDALFGDFEKSGAAIWTWRKAVRVVGIPEEKFALVVKHARQGHPEARKALDRVQELVKAYGPPSEASIGTMGNWGDPARTAGENVRSDKVGEPQVDFVPRKRRKRPRRKDLIDPKRRFDVVGLTAGEDWAREYDPEDVTITTRIKTPQPTTAARESMEHQQRARIAYRQTAKLDEVPR
jgi:hypothetical protein